MKYMFDQMVCAHDLLHRSLGFEACLGLRALPHSGVPSRIRVAQGVGQSMDKFLMWQPAWAQGKRRRDMDANAHVNMLRGCPV